MTFAGKDLTIQGETLQQFKPQQLTFEYIFYSCIFSYVIHFANFVAG